MRIRQIHLYLSALAILLTVGGCKTKPRYVVGDHLIPLGSSDPTQIVTVVAVEPQSYRVALGGSAAPDANVQTRPRGEIDSYYVRVELPVGGSWARREDLATPVPSATRTPSATPQPTATATVPPDFDKLSGAVQPAVVLISVFDRSGKLTRTGTGFFVSDDGRIVTTFRTIAGAINAIAKAGGGKIYNISGVLVSSSAEDIAVLKADATRVSFIIPNKVGRVGSGTHVGIVESSIRRRGGAVSDATVTSTSGDENSAEWQLSGASLIGSAGAPVIDGQGDLVGIVTTDESGVRSASVIAPLVAQIVSGTTARWPAAGSPTPSPTPSATAQPKPSASPRQQVGGLVYAPQPRYPAAARFSYRKVEGTGRYSVQFGANGLVTDVQTVQSSGSDALDNAALDTLRTWRAQPGRPSQRVVVIPFKKPSP